MEKISSSCDPNVEHVIFNCDEIVHLHNDVYLKTMYVEKERFEGRLIGVHACEKDGTLIENGLILVLENGVFIRQENLNHERFPFMDLDSKGRIKVVR